MDESEEYLWFCEMNCVQWQRPAHPGDDEYWEWLTFAAEWARELLRPGQ